MIPDDNPLVLIRGLLGDDIEVRKYITVSGEAVPQPIWFPATIVHEDRFDVIIAYVDGGQERLRKAEHRFRRREMNA